MGECSRCRERWQDERRLSAQFQAMREAAAWYPSAARRQQLMLEFDRVHNGGWRLWLKWALNTAAILLVALALVHDWIARHPAGNAGQGARLEAGAASDTAEDAGFVDVPYAPPLAPGAFVAATRTALSPAALTVIGIDSDDAEGRDIPADTRVG